MAAALAITPASGAVNAKKDFCRVDVTGADQTVKHRIKATQSGKETLLSHDFQPSSDGKHSWFNVMFPDTGTWTLTLYETANDGTVATATVVVI